MTPAELQTYLLSLVLGEIVEARQYARERREAMLLVDRELDNAERILAPAALVKKTRARLVAVTNSAEAAQRRVRRAEAAYEAMKK